MVSFCHSRIAEILTQSIEINQEIRFLSAMSHLQTWEGSNQNVAANWYPGHMFKTKKDLQQLLKQVDVVLEVRDARIPMSSASSELHLLMADKTSLIVLNKADLANPNLTHLWKQHFLNAGQHCHISNSLHPKTLRSLVQHLEEVAEVKRQKFLQKRIQPPSLRIAILGVPNSGKSTLLNRFAKKKSVQTGNRPGITKHAQWVTISKQIELLDTPGMLQPRFQDVQTGMKLALVGSIKDEIVGIEKLATYWIDFCLKQFPKKIQQTYQIKESLQNTEEIVETIAKLHGCLTSGNQIEWRRVCNKIVQDFRAGRFGRISLELVPNQMTAV